MGRTLPEVRCWLCPYLKYWVLRGSSVTTTCFPPAVQRTMCRTGTDRAALPSPGRGAIIGSWAQMRLGRSRQTPRPGEGGAGPPSYPVFRASRLLANLKVGKRRRSSCAPAGKSFLVLNDIQRMSWAQEEARPAPLAHSPPQAQSPCSALTPHTDPCSLLFFQPAARQGPLPHAVQFLESLC